MQFLLPHQTELKIFVVAFCPLNRLIPQNCNYLHLYMMIEMNLMNDHVMVLCFLSMKSLTIHLQFDLDMMLMLMALKMRIAVMAHLFVVFQMLLDFQLNMNQIKQIKLLDFHCTSGCTFHINQYLHPIRSFGLRPLYFA